MKTEERQQSLQPGEVFEHLFFCKIGTLVTNSYFTSLNETLDLHMHQQTYLLCI